MPKATRLVLDVNTGETVEEEFEFEEVVVEFAPQPKSIVEENLDMLGEALVEALTTIEELKERINVLEGEVNA